MKHYSFLTLAVIIVSASLCISVFEVGAKGNGRSSQAIFDYAGHEKPADWGVWEQEQKHAYYRSLGLYPASGNKYQGEFDVDRYFGMLGVNQPDNWDALSLPERQEFVRQVSLGEVENDRQIAEDNIVDGEGDRNENREGGGERENDVIENEVQPLQDDSVSFPLWLQLLLFGAVGAAIIGAKSLIVRK